MHTQAARNGSKPWWNRYALRVGKARTPLARLAVQIGFVLVNIIIGFQFYRFVQAARDGSSGPLPVRPPGVEGYLPISGLMGVLDWIYQGTLNRIHPAATILFLTFVLGAILVRKSFCGWICPVGFLSEMLARLGQAGIGRNLRIHRWVDIPLRGIKYLLLGFFVWAVFTMSPEALNGFIQSPYNKVSDIKMLDFFVDISLFAAIVVSVLALASIVVHSFWCRYLCPYGALLGLFSWLSPMKVYRSEAHCTDCGICDRVCPARLPVSRKESISSVECIGCTDCVESCPAPSALHFGTRRRAFSPTRVALFVVGIFLVATTIGRFTGHWRSGLSDAEVRQHVERMESLEYGHPGMQQ